MVSDERVLLYNKPVKWWGTTGLGLATYADIINSINDASLFV